MSKVEIANGEYRLMGKIVPVSGVFELVGSVSEDAAGIYLTVVNSSIKQIPRGSVRVRVSDHSSYRKIESSSVTGPAVNDSAVEESDESIIERLRLRFDQLEQMTRAVKSGAIRAMIVSGPPGVGKSHGVERQLERYQMLESLGGAKRYEIVKGAMSAIGLYVKLFKYSSKDSVIVFDDCDSVFSDELSLNILKAALDSKKRRTIHWNTDSHKLRNEGVPDQFCFEGSCIFITNLKFDRARGKIREHLAALESRCHYMDLTIDTDREKLLRIRQIVLDGMLDEYEFDSETVSSIVEFVEKNSSRLRELSLRSVIKIADLVAAFPREWRAYAENTVMRRGR